jgi:hypothetical protein
LIFLKKIKNKNKNKKEEVAKDLIWLRHSLRLIEGVPPNKN